MCTSCNHGPNSTFPQCEPADIRNRERENEKETSTLNPFWVSIVSVALLFCCDLMLCPWCHLPLWLGQTFSVKITFSVPLLLCVLQEAREGLREAMAKDVVTLNAELSASHDEKGSGKHGHIPAIPDLDHHLLLSTPSLSAEMPMLLTMTSQGGTWDFQKKITSLQYHEYNVSHPVLEDEDGDTLQNDTTTF